MRSVFDLLGLKRRKKDEEITFATWHSGGKGDGIAPQQNSTRYFSFNELQMSTDNFSESNVIGTAFYGKVYKGYLSSTGLAVAIKRVQGGFYQGVEEFKTEIELLSRVHHKNIVSLLGFCFEQGEQILVYKYISKGTLRDNLNGKTGTCFNWKQRLHIALDVARGLAYLHELAIPQIIHRDVKSSNILLDEYLTAKVISFDLSILNRDKVQVLANVMVEGTKGYIDPEYFVTSQFSEKSDVYSFGVVMLELLTARRAYGFDQDGEFTLKGKVMTAFNTYDQEYYGLRDIIDPKIVNQVRNIGLTKFVQLAFACLKESGSDRPFMREVMKELDVILQNEGSGGTAGKRAFGGDKVLECAQKCRYI